MSGIQKHDLICEACIKDAGCVACGTVMTINNWRDHWEINYKGLLHHADAGCIVCKRTHKNLRVTCVTNLIVEKEK